MPFSFSKDTQIGSGRVEYSGFGKISDPRIVSTITNGFLTLAIDPNNPGDYYTATPTITITDRGGTTSAPPAVTATGTAGISAGAVTGVALGVGGHYYSSVPAVTVGAVPGASGASVVAIVTAGAVSSFSVAAGGVLYTAVPSITVAAPPPAIQPTTTGNLGNGYVVDVILGGSGGGYTIAPAVSFATNAGGNGAAATALMDLSAGVITGFQVTNPGNGNYTAAPAVTLTGGGFTTASTATCQILAKLASITGVAGFGYTSVPNASITHPQGIVINQGGASYQISRVNSPTVLGIAADTVQWTFPTITQATQFATTQYPKRMILPNPNPIIAFTRLGSTPDLQFSAGWESGF